uniref:Uncharacterized protein n=1 Tax=Anguilla anguilla TaxID=7936 RepID=A0A0E9SQ27_ANGAN
MKVKLLHDYLNVCNY